VCSGRHRRTRNSERTQGDTVPSQLVSANEAGRRVYQTKQRVGPERLTSSRRRRPWGAFSL
jgi:hypothetical protein